MGVSVTDMSTCCRPYELCTVECLWVSGSGERVLGVGGSVEESKKV